MKEGCIIHIIGGASGVGKTSLLKLFSDFRQVNTGDLFKSSMSLLDRDEIRRGDWPEFETEVTKKLINIASESIRFDEDVIIDTHFAAKTHSKSYRMGLKEECLYQFGRSIINLIADNEAVINVILITTNPYLLLTRRRLDKYRNRELVPSDCYNDLRSNNAYFHKYSFAFRRAGKEASKDGKSFSIEQYVIENDVFELAKQQLTRIIRR